MNIKLFKKIIKGKNWEISYDADIYPYTTIKTGGKASVLIHSKNSSELENILIEITKLSLPYKILGKGSNVLISGKGFEGIIIINSSIDYEILDTIPEDMNQSLSSKARLKKTAIQDGYDKENTDYETVLIRVDSGYSLKHLIKDLFKKQIYGLEWFSGIPSTIGGAVYMNMHGGTHFFGDLVYGAKLFNGKGISSVDKEYFQFDYDYSKLQKTGEIILSVDLLLKKGDVSQAFELHKKWLKSKSNQPQRSAGCVFQNISREEMKEKNLPTQSLGYIIDKLLNLKGFQIGGAQISTDHAAFIVNTGEATADDIYKLVQYVENKADTKLGLKLKREIELIGSFE